MATHYFWDEMEDNVVEEYDGDTGDTIASYTTEPTRYGSVLSQDRSGEKRYYQFDGQDNATELTGPLGDVTDQRRYSGFGDETISTGESHFSWQWGGQAGYSSDREFTLTAIRRRHYAPSTARWLSVDPLGHFSDFNLYRSVHNSPISLVDPSGLIDPFIGGFIIGACIGFGAAGCQYHLEQCVINDNKGTPLTAAQVACIKRARYFAMAAVKKSRESWCDKGPPNSDPFPSNGGIFGIPPYMAGPLGAVPMTCRPPKICNMCVTVLPSNLLACASCAELVELIATLVHEQFHCCQSGIPLSENRIECPVYLKEIQVMDKAKIEMCKFLVGSGFCVSLKECIDAVHANIHDALEWMIEHKCNNIPIPGYGSPLPTVEIEINTSELGMR